MSPEGRAGNAAANSAVEIASVDVRDQFNSA